MKFLTNKFSINIMDSSELIKQIALSGVLTGLGLLMGFFGYFHMGIYGIYLIGSVVFLLPLIIKFPFAIISSVIIVTMTDVFSGWGANTWISFIAYTLAIFILYAFKSLKYKLFYFIGTIIASIEIIFIYFIFSIPLWGIAAAIGGVVPNIIQMSLVVSVTWVLYLPIIRISKLIK